MINLKGKALKGLGWSAIDGISNTGITFLIGLILARILSPSEFGLIGMITIFIAISNSIVDSGFSSALIQKSNASRVDYNTVFYFNIFLGFLLYGILFLTAPTISIYFDEPVLTDLIRTISIIIIINSFGIVQRTLLVKKVDFKTQTKVSLISTISGAFVGVLMALQGFGVWSLIFQQISKQFLNTFFLWIYSSWRPRIEISINSFRQLFGFGSKLLLSGLIDTIYKNLYYLVIGKYFSTAKLGYYTRAEQFNSLLSSNLSMLVQRVSYPIFCNIKNENQQLKIIFTKFLKYTMFFSFSLMLGLAAVSKSLVLVLIGEKWLPSVPYIQIMCFAGMLYPLHAINLNMVLVKGRSDLFLKFEIIKKIIGLIPILFGIYYGINALLIGSVFLSIIAFFINSYRSKELINYSPYSQILDISPSFFVAVFVSLTTWSLTFLNFPAGITLILQFAIIIILTRFIHKRMKNKTYLEIKSLLIDLIKRKKKVIPITKPFLPKKREYNKLVSKIFKINWLTNMGPLSNKLEKELKKYLKVENLLYVNNGTVALQMAIKVLKLKGEIITTPFSFIATTSSISWEGCTPIFVDIDKYTLNIDPRKIENSITDKTTAILATHVYGNPCDVLAIEMIAKKHNLKVIYDGAHAFGVRIEGKSIFEYGDISICSLHATKLYHSIEGGLLITKSSKLNSQLSYMRNFGINGPETFAELGLNAKNSEFHAAMGLVNLKHIKKIHERRKMLSELYDTNLTSFSATRQIWHQKSNPNYAYYSILIESEELLLSCIEKLKTNNIFSRRYFYPALSSIVHYVKPIEMPIAEDISKRVLCLPLYYDLTTKDVKLITDLLIITQNEFKK